MTVPHALTVAAEVSLLVFWAGGFIVLVCSLGMLGALKIRRLWYRWRVRREVSQMDRVSLGTLATFRRKD